MYIRAVIYVERDSQKRIVIGHQGTRIREIGRAARLKIEELVSIAGLPGPVGQGPAELAPGSGRAEETGVHTAGGPAVMTLSEQLARDSGLPEVQG